MIEFDVKCVYESRTLVASVRALMSNLISARKDAAVKAHVDEMRKRFIRRTEKAADTPPADNEG